MFCLFKLHISCHTNHIDADWEHKADDVRLTMDTVRLNDRLDHLNVM